MTTENLFDYDILISPNYEYDQKQFVDRFKKFVNMDLKKLNGSTLQMDMETITNKDLVVL